MSTIVASNGSDTKGGMKSIGIHPGAIKSKNSYTRPTYDPQML